MSCILCCDEDNDDLDDIKCGVCNFLCCEECYNKIESNCCPSCKNPHFKHYHEETISTTDSELFQDVIQQLEQVIIQQYESNIIILMTMIHELTNKNIEKDKLIEKYKLNKVVCECGKQIKEQNYNKHIQSKYHKDRCTNII